MFCCTLLYVHSSIVIILIGKRELVALLNLSSWCLMMVEPLFLGVPRGCLRFVIVVFPDHTHLLILYWLNRSTFTNREDPDAKLKSHIMQLFIRVNTVCYGKKELQVQKYNINIFRKVYLTPLNIYNGLSQVSNCFKPESKNY